MYIFKSNRILKKSSEIQERKIFNNLLKNRLPRVYCPTEFLKIRSRYERELNFDEEQAACSVYDAAVCESSGLCRKLRYGMIIDLGFPCWV